MNRHASSNIPVSTHAFTSVAYTSPPASVSHRSRLASLISPLRRVLPRVPFWQLKAHRVPVLWGLYRGLLRSAPTGEVCNGVLFLRKLSFISKFSCCLLFLTHPAWIVLCRDCSSVADLLILACTDCRSEDQIARRLDVSQAETFDEPGSNQISIAQRLPRTFNHTRT